MKTFLKLLVAASLCMMWTAVQGEDPKAGAEQQMPPMGKPAEMDNVLKAAGTWTGSFQSRMDDKSEFTTSTCTSVMEPVLDNCAMMTNFSTTFMGMPFKGMGLLTYDREKKKWTQTWIDNMGASQFQSEGTWSENKLSMQGGGVMGGMSYLMREVTTYVDASTINWVADMSYDGGKTWFTIMKADYKKKA
jgi:hypothetical protein